MHFGCSVPSLYFVLCACRHQQVEVKLNHAPLPAMPPHSTIAELKSRIQALEAENALLRRDFSTREGGSMVQVPEAMRPLFEEAQQQVGAYFSDLKMEPTRGTIEIHEERYVLVRASALSKDFLQTIQQLYADRGPAEAMAIGKNFLFDIAHVVGANDARSFGEKMHLTDPLSKLSAGPVHFAYSGWAFVDISPESSPTPDENFYLSYSHPYSFEADSWIRSGERSETPVCIMNAGYSSGWCEESFGIPLTSVEVTCIAKGDARCSFIMSPPHKIQEHLDRFRAQETPLFKTAVPYEIPTFFERKKVEEEMVSARLLAEESVKAKDDFVANISHELRTPLGIILGFTDLLRKTQMEAKQGEYLEAIHAAGTSLLAVINNILDLSKLEGGHFTIERIPFNVPAVLDTIRVMFSGKAAEKGVALTCTAGEGIAPLLRGDPTCLKQILTNLVGNALKFTPAGSIHIDCSLQHTEAGSQQLLFQVSDTGIGIPADKQSQVFQRFTQADADITRRYGGTGLGLAITEQLVALQGGTISLKSVEGRGTVFSFRLTYPISKTGLPAAPVSVAIPAVAATISKRILVVEDNPMMQRLAEEMLRNNGLEVALAGNGEEAVAAVRAQKFDLILMDIQMPVMDGYKATCMIRDELRDNTPIIAITAYALESEKDTCIHGGMNDYVAKPFREETLMGRIRYWLAQAPPAGITSLDYLKEQSHNNTAFMEEMIQLFLSQTPQHLQKIDAAVAANDLETLAKTVHTLRNTIGFFGLEKAIGAELAEIETLARTGLPAENLPGLISPVKKVFQQALEELREAGNRARI